MAFTPKDWKDAPDHSTPLSAAALEDLETRVAGYADSLSGGSGRSILSALSDRTAGYWDPAVTSTFDNLDGSPVVLEIPTPGFWFIGWEGYVKGSGGGADAEVDLGVTPAGTVDPLSTADFVVSGTMLVDQFQDQWLRAFTMVEVTDPIQIAAYVYASGSGTLNVKVTANPDAPRLFAWPNG